MAASVPARAGSGGVGEIPTTVVPTTRSIKQLATTPPSMERRDETAGAGTRPV